MGDVVDVAGTYRRCLRVNYDIKQALLEVIVYADAEAAWVKVFPVDPARLCLHRLGRIGEIHPKGDDIILKNIIVLHLFRFHWHIRQFVP